MSSETRPSVDDVWPDWRDTINMTAREIEKWLETPASRSLRVKPDGEEDHSGHRVAKILRRPKAHLTSEDAEHMLETVAYIRRRLAHRPLGDVRESRWRYSLMNWGHDPLKS